MKSIQRFLALTLTIIVFSCLLTGCGVLEIIGSMREFDFENDVVPKTEAIYTMPFVVRQEQTAQNLKWEVYPFEGKSDKEIIGASWDEIKDMDIGNYEMAIGYYESSPDDMTFYIGSEEVKNRNQSWSELLESRKGDVIFMYTLDCNAAEVLFGDDFADDPIKAIKKTCGKPSMVITNGAFYRLGEYSIMITVEDDEDLGEILTIVQVPD